MNVIIIRVENDRFEIHTDKHKAVELCIWTELQDIENSMNELA